MTFINDATRFAFTYLLPRKSDAYEAYTIFADQNAARSGGVGTLRSDNGGEYSSHKFKEHLRTNGTFAQRTTPDTPQQNSVAERLNRTLHEMANSMMIHASMSLRLWGEAMQAATDLRNRAPTAALEGSVTPLEALTGGKPDLSHARVFGCEAYARVNGHVRKFEPKATRCVFVGYADATKGYRLWDLEAKKIIIRRDVRFNETNFPFSEATPSQPRYEGERALFYLPGYEPVSSAPESKVVPKQRCLAHRLSAARTCSCT
jgi:hypothetical protein